MWTLLLIFSVPSDTCIVVLVREKEVRKALSTQMKLPGFHISRDVANNKQLCVTLALI